MSTPSTLDRAIALLQSADVQSHAAIVGFDGFVDQIIRVVQKKNSPSSADYFPSISSLADRIAAASGKSTALEMHIQVTKLGGNGPIMANAMAAYGLPLTYIGAVGAVDGEGVHPVFQPMAERSTVYPVCIAAKTDALEFNDGKLMFQQMQCLDNLDYDLIRRVVGEDKLQALYENATCLAMNHWSSLPHMTNIWRRLQADVCPKLSKKKRYLFVDLADTYKRSEADLRAAFEALAGFNPWYDTTLGLNEGEAEHVCGILDCEPHTKAPHAKMRARAEILRERLNLSCVTVHPVAFAAAATANDTAVVEGAYTPTPKISTGAGDHFNAGFFFGRVLGGDLEQALQLGVGTSGYYVRTAVSPSVAQLIEFLSSLRPKA